MDRNKQILIKALKKLDIPVTNDNMVKKSQIIAALKKITSVSKEDIIKDVTNLSSGTLSKLLKDEGLDIKDYSTLDKLHRKFIQFVIGALDSSPSAYKNWMDAWDYFKNTYDLITLNLKTTSHKLTAKQSRVSLKAPKEWWDMMEKDIKESNPDYTKEQIAKTIGDIWANKLSEKKKAQIRRRYGKEYGPAKS